MLSLVCRHLDLCVDKTCTHKSGECEHTSERPGQGKREIMTGAREDVRQRECNAVKNAIYSKHRVTL